MRFSISHITVPGIIYYIENARGCTVSPRYCDAIQPRLFAAIVPSVEETRPGAHHPYPPNRRAHLRMGVAHPLCAPAGEAEPLRGSLIDSAESMSGSGSGSAALNR